VAAVVSAVALAAPELRGRALPVLIGAIALALVGLRDDRLSLPAGVRVAAQVLVAAAVVLALGGLEQLPFPPPLDWRLGVLGGPVAVLWLVTVVNIFNFLDGIDGLASLQAADTAVRVLLAAWDPALSVVAGALAGAVLGFLPFNWSPASVFLGDSGSYFLGFALAALPLAAPEPGGSGAVLFVGLSLWLFLADASWTLVRRALRGERVHEAHREHLYQQLARRFGHARVTLSIGVASAAITLVAVAAARGGTAEWAWAALAVAAACFAVEATAASRARLA
jgi:Fuc2NAc and GlcNAc transferase